MTSKRWADHGQTKVHLGCGTKILSGFINVDLEIGDVHADLTKRFPFKSRTVDYVFSEDFLEHIPQEKAIFVISEIYRILKYGGSMEHYIPNAGSINAFASPSHLSHWNTRTFEYFEKGNRHFDLDVRFNGFKGKGFEMVTCEEINVQDGVAQGIHVIMRKCR